MDLQLNRPIVFFDLETTGISVSTDRIVEIAILKIYPNGNREAKTWLVNPEIEIPKEASDIHGITNEKVVNEPTFVKLAPQVSSLIKGCDFGGFNLNRFDIPLLAEEMLRAGEDFDLKNATSVDVQVIFHKKEQRTLSAAYSFYCNKELVNAHSAEADTLATYEILKAQLDTYKDLENNIPFLSDFSTQKKFADLAGFIGYNAKGSEIFSFGKYKGKEVSEILKKDSGYFSWILNAEFPRYTKKVLSEIRLRSLNTKEN